MPRTAGNKAQGDHATGQVETLTNAKRVHVPPNGMKFKTKEEKKIWLYLMRSRAYGDWTPTDLNTCVKVVQSEYMIRQGQRKLEEFIELGDDPFMPDTVANAYSKNIALMQRQQIALLRSLGFGRNSMPNGGEPDKRRAQREREAADMLDSGIPDMLADV